MAKRPIFVAHEAPPFYRTVWGEFVFNPGFAAVQKQKNIVALHDAYQQISDDTPLEISSKSLQPEGICLSAFHLEKQVPSLGCSVPVECAYQGSKVFETGGPFTDLYLKTPREAKRDSRLAANGKIVSFHFEGNTCSTLPVSCFYDWLYIRALIENPSLSRALLAYSAFTDIEFNPEKSINCQARAAAVFVALSRLQLLEQTERFEDFRVLFMKGANQ